MRRFAVSDNPEYTEKNIADNKVVDMYEEYYATARPIQVWDRERSHLLSAEWNKLIEAMPSDLQDIQSNVKSVVCEYSWKIVMTAKDDAELIPCLMR